MDMNDLKSFHGPKSMCRCGHLGDGPYSDHEDLYVDRGHGKCKKCGCEMFVWKSFTPAFAEMVEKAKGKSDENHMEDNS